MSIQCNCKSYGLAMSFCHEVKVNANNLNPCSNCDILKWAFSFVFFFFFFFICRPSKFKTEILRHLSWSLFLVKS